MQQAHVSILLRVIFRHAFLRLVLNIKEGLDKHFMVFFFMPVTVIASQCRTDASRFYLPHPSFCSQKHASK